MKLTLDRVNPGLYHSAIRCAERYHIEYMFDGRKPGLRNCVIFSASPEPAFAIYHTPKGDIVVRQNND